MRLAILQVLNSSKDKERFDVTSAYEVSVFGELADSLALHRGFSGAEVGLIESLSYRLVSASLYMMQVVLYTQIVPLLSSDL